MDILRARLSNPLVGNETPTILTCDHDLFFSRCAMPRVPGRRSSPHLTAFRDPCIMPMGHKACRPATVSASTPLGVAARQYVHRCASPRPPVTHAHPAAGATRASSRAVRRLRGTRPEHHGQRQERVYSPSSRCTIAARTDPRASARAAPVWSPWCNVCGRPLLREGVVASSPRRYPAVSLFALHQETIR